MIGYIKGPITFKSPAFVYVEASGVGYHLNITLHTYSKLEKLAEVKLFTHLHVKEDSLTLFGFFDGDERELFVQLLSVSGVGPNTARIILSSMTSDDAKQAILGEDELAFKQVKGIGAKTAKQIILDLKSKVVRGVENLVVAPQVDNTLRTEALSALLALGFQKNKVLKAISDAYKANPQIDRVELLIKEALKKLSS